MLFVNNMEVLFEYTEDVVDNEHLLSPKRYVFTTNQIPKIIIAMKSLKEILKIRIF